MPEKLLSIPFSRYPSHPLLKHVWSHLAAYAPTTLTALGNLDLLQHHKLAFFCSIKCPGHLILQTYDLVRTLHDARIAMISGFHSPIEKECLTLLLRGTQPIIICPARSLQGMRLPAAWKTQMTGNRLLLLSPFDEKYRRATAELARLRNYFVATLADAVFIPYAAPGSKTEEFVSTILDWGKPVLTLDSDHNAGLLTRGAKIFQQFLTAL